MDWTAIIVAIISAGIPAVVTLVANKGVKKQANKHNARSNILQLIMEDHLKVMEGGLPENYQSILDSFDEYKACDGNSYVHDKVEEYKKWYLNFSEKVNDNKKEDK